MEERGEKEKERERNKCKERSFTAGTMLLKCRRKDWIKIMILNSR